MGQKMIPTGLDACVLKLQPNKEAFSAHCNSTKSDLVCENVRGIVGSTAITECSGGNPTTTAQVEMMKWHKEKRFVSAGLKCSYDLLWKTTAIGCSDSLYVTQCNALLQKEFGDKGFGFPKAGVMDCQVKRSLNEIKWAEAMPQVAQAMAVGYNYNAQNAGKATGPECKRDDSDPLMLYCAGMPASPTSDGYRLTEQLLGKGLVRECTKEERDDKHWVATPCIVWSRVTAPGNVGGNVSSNKPPQVTLPVPPAPVTPQTPPKANLGGNLGANLGSNLSGALTPPKANNPPSNPSNNQGSTPALTAPVQIAPPTGLGSAKAPAGLSGSSASNLALSAASAARDAAAFKQCKPFKGHMNDMLCSGEPAFKACKKLVDKGEMKTCRLANTKEIYP
jgi:hypothetical protein